MIKKLLLILISLGFVLGAQTANQAQESPDFHVVVNMVQLNVAVTDKSGNYVTGLRPSDFAIYEDGILRKRQLPLRKEMSQLAVSENLRNRIRQRRWDPTRR